MGFDLRRKLTINQLDGLEISEVFNLRNALTILSFVIFVSIAFICTKWNTVVVFAIFAVGIGKIFDSATESNHAIYQYLNSENKILISRVIKFAFSLLAFLLGDHNNFITIFSLYLLLNAIPFFLIDIFSIKKLIPNLHLLSIHINIIKVKEFVKVNSGLAAGSLLMVLTQNVPTYFIKFFLDFKSVAYFSSVNFVLQALYISGGAGLAYSLLKKFTNSGKNACRNNVKLLLKSSIFSLVSYGLFGLIFYVSHGLTIFFGKDYANRYDLFFILLGAGVFFTIASFLNNYLLFCNQKKWVFNLRIVRILVVIILCIAIPFYYKSVNAFGYALLVTNLIDCIFHSIFIKKIQIN
jgi:O-antigen/teichoic acid export membrane protein